MKGPCATCYGVIRTIGVGGELAREEQDTLLGRTYPKHSTITMD